MKITATPRTAAAAGIFSAVAWPPLWSAYGAPGSSGDMELILGTLLVVALPAHALVVGFNRAAPADARTLDTALFRRIGA